MVTQGNALLIQGSVAIRLPITPVTTPEPLVPSSLRTRSPVGRRTGSGRPGVRPAHSGRCEWPRIAATCLYQPPRSRMAAGIAGCPPYRWFGAKIGRARVMDGGATLGGDRDRCAVPRSRSHPDERRYANSTDPQPHRQIAPPGYGSRPVTPVARSLFAKAVLSQTSRTAASGIRNSAPKTLASRSRPRSASWEEGLRAAIGRRLAHPPRMTDPVAELVGDRAAVAADRDVAGLVALSALTRISRSDGMSIPCSRRSDH